MSYFGESESKLVREYKCPNGHRVVHTWNADEVRQAVAGKGLHFYCILCNESRRATTLEQALILKALGLPIDTTEVLEAATIIEKAADNGA